MKTTPLIETKLKEAEEKGFLVYRTENNPFLKLSFKGKGDFITEKWNVKIYTSGSIVCTDNDVLRKILNDEVSLPDSSLKVIQIDDAGWGFPLCGVMVGICNETDIYTGVVPVEYFQKDLFSTKKYLKAYAQKGLEILEGLKISKETHRIEICTGYINSSLKKSLRKLGFDVTVTEIKGLLQDKLEFLFKEYVKEETGLDLAYDPKVLKKKQISRAYRDVLAFGMTQAPRLLKTGWKSIKKELEL